MEIGPYFIEVAAVAGGYRTNDVNQSAFDTIQIVKCCLFKTIWRIPDGVWNVIFWSESHDTHILPPTGSSHVIKSGVLGKQGHRTHCELGAYPVRIWFTLKYEARAVPVKLERSYDTRCRCGSCQWFIGGTEEGRIVEATDYRRNILY